MQVCFHISALSSAGKKHCPENMLYPFLLPLSACHIFKKKKKKGSHVFTIKVGLSELSSTFLSMTEPQHSTWQMRIKGYVIIFLYLVCTAWEQVGGMNFISDAPSSAV